MRISRYTALLDACVLIPMPVADTLLRLAEEEFYLPRWSKDILAEVEHTLGGKYKYSPKQVARRIDAMRINFPDAMVEGYESLVEAMQNDSKDRHVLAAAVRCGAHGIVSNNKKHFPDKFLAPLGVECLTADEFMQHQYHLDPDCFIGILNEQASDIGWSLHELIAKHVPCLANLIGTPPPD